MNAPVPPDRITREETIFNAAVELREPAKRAAYLELACDGDPALRARLEKMLAADADSFFEKPIPSPLLADAAPFVASAAPVAEPMPLSERIGRYKLLQKIGEGGCGVVYLAEQEEPVRRRVALKVIKLGMDTKSVIARFEAERQALALMDHPNIAKVLDAGATEMGRPYFVMELVHGVSITEYCDKNQMPTRQRLDLFMQVCHAVQSAHQKGIIHRDLKPSNILVTLNDGVPLPMVIDFGIAKATNQKLTEKTLFTNYGTMIGTPAYMSPEQAEMSKLDVDTRTDIYALGVLLYELLTATTPFPTKELLSLGFGEMQRVIAEREPLRPSTRLSTMTNDERTVVAKNRSMEVSALGKLFRGDLDWIVMKCLEKDRTRRYDTATGLANDVQRHLNNEAVLARPASAGYRFQKLVRRNKLAVAAVTGVAVVLVLGVAVSTWQAFRATQSKREAVDQRQAADKSAQEARQAEQKAELARADADEAAAKVTRNLYSDEMILAGQAAVEQGGISRIAELTAKWLPEKGAADQRGWEWYYLQSLTHLDLFTLRGHTNAVRSVSWSRDGKRLVSASKDSTIRVWDADSRLETLTLHGHTNDVTSVAWSPDERRLASGSWDNTIKVWDAVSGTNIQTLSGHTGGVNSVVWSPDGKRLASASGDKTIKVWDADSGNNIYTLTGHTSSVLSLAWRSDGKRLASGSWDNTIKVWDAASGTNIHTLRGHAFPVFSVAWSPDGKRLAAAMSSVADSHTLMVWDVDRETTTHILRGHIGFVNSVAWSLDGSRLASGSWDNTIMVWDAVSGANIHTLRGHTNAVQSVAWSPDGKRLASGSEDNMVKVWDADKEETMTLRGHTNDVTSVAWSPDGKRLASAGDKTLQVWDADSGQKTLTLSGHTAAVQAVAWSPNGQRLASGSWDNTVKVWDAATEQEALSTLVGHTGAVVAVEWSPDGKRLASASFDGTVKIWELVSGHVIRTFYAPNHSFFSVSWSLDGKHLASASSDETVKVWDADSGQVIHDLRGHTFYVSSVAWSRDGGRLASASFDKTVKVWDTASGRVIRDLRGHTAAARWVAWSPNGKRLASGSFDKTVKVWDAELGTEILTLRGHTDDVFSVSWSPDGQRLVSASVDKTIKVWDAGKGFALEHE